MSASALARNNQPSKRKKTSNSRLFCIYHIHLKDFINSINYINRSRATFPCMFHGFFSINSSLFLCIGIPTLSLSISCSHLLEREREEFFFYHYYFSKCLAFILGMANLISSANHIQTHPLLSWAECLLCKSLTMRFAVMYYFFSFFAFYLVNGCIANCPNILNFV